MLVKTYHGGLLHRYTSMTWQPSGDLISLEIGVILFAGMWMLSTVAFVSAFLQGAWC